MKCWLVGSFSAPLTLSKGESKRWLRHGPFLSDPPTRKLRRTDALRLEEPSPRIRKLRHLLGAPGAAGGVAFCLQGRRGPRERALAPGISRVFGWIGGTGWSQELQGPTKRGIMGGDGSLALVFRGESIHSRVSSVQDFHAQ